MNQEEHWKQIHEEAKRMRESDSLPAQGSVANLLGIDRPVSWLDAHVFPNCNEVWDTHGNVFQNAITNIFVSEGCMEIAELLHALGKANVIWLLANNMYMLGYAKCLDEVQRDRAILDKLEK